MKAKLQHLAVAAILLAAPASVLGVNLGKSGESLSVPLQIAIVLTLLTLLPAVIMSITPFLSISIVRLTGSNLVFLKRLPSLVVYVGRHRLNDLHGKKQRYPQQDLIRWRSSQPLKAFLVKIGLPDRSGSFHAVPHHRSGGRFGNPFDRHDAAAACHDFSPVQDPSLRPGRRLESRHWLFDERLLRMTPETVIELVRHALVTALWLSAPLLAVGFVAGIVVSFVQILTSIQDSAFNAIPRLLAFLTAFVLAMPWMLQKMTVHMVDTLGNLGRYGN
jgi:flagellar biosynthetic protein FliQ